MDVLRALPRDLRALTGRLETERLVLRRPGEADLPLFSRLGGDPQLELAEALDHWRVESFGHWVIEEDGAPVGVLEVHRAGPGIGGIAADEVELGWALVESAQGRGIATEAARAAAADAFERVRPPWLVAYIRLPNAASMRVADKLGMRHEADGTTRSGEPMRIYRLRRPRPDEPM